MLGVRALLRACQVLVVIGTFSDPYGSLPTSLQSDHPTRPPYHEYGVLDQCPSETVPLHDPGLWQGLHAGCKLWVSGHHRNPFVFDG